MNLLFVTFNNFVEFGDFVLFICEEQKGVLFSDRIIAGNDFERNMNLSNGNRCIVCSTIGAMTTVLHALQQATGS